MKKDEWIESLYFTLDIIRKDIKKMIRKFDKLEVKPVVSRIRKIISDAESELDQKCSTTKVKKQKKTVAKAKKSVKKKKK